MDLPAFTSCPACGAAATDARTLFSAGFFGGACRVLECGRCGLVYKDRHPEDGAMADLYSADYAHFTPGTAPDAADVNSLKQKLRRCAGLLPAGRPQREIRVLDVGCGNGGTVRIARLVGYAADGIDPFLPDALAGDGIRRATLDEVPAAQYDVLLLLNVAEHVTRPAALFAAARRTLRSGGVLLVTCPNGASLARRYHRDRWSHLALDEHLLFWTPRSLRRALAAAGFGGRMRVRFAGSPFPFGRAAPPEPATSPAAAQPAAPATPTARGFQAHVWQLARQIQRNDAVAVAVQAGIHLLRLGDYLECVAATGDA